jgi:protein-tyrosine phosphatase
MQNRILELEGVHNYRDLGGLGIMDFGKVIRGESPHNLSPSAFDQLLEMGVNTVIDLRSEAEILEHPNPLATREGINYQHIPLFAVLQQFSKSEEKTFPPLEMVYIAALELCQDAIKEALTVAANANGTVLLHCVAGKDRTGIISMLLAGLAGATREALLEDYALTAHATPLLERLRLDAQEKGYDMSLYSSILSAKPETMAMVLDHLEQKHGGIIGYVQNTLQLEPQTMIRLSHT